MLAPCHCAKFPDSALVALDLEAPEPFRSAPAASPSSRVFKNHACMVAIAACGGCAPEGAEKPRLQRGFPLLRKRKPPDELQARIAWFIPKVLPPHHTTNARTCAGSAPPPMVESRAVLRHVLGSIRKEKLMDTQTVIAVCELLLVVIGIVTLARKDE